METKPKSNTFKFPNESFSGVDMIATAQIRDFENPKTSNTVSLGSIQTISYSIHMDRKPIRSIGNINVKDYVLGPRTIAGSLIFAVFNKHFAYKMIEDVNLGAKPSRAFMVDELPPFDITISMSNEYGYESKLAIYGIRLVNEGQVMSVNDIYTENTYQFVATDLEYLTDQKGYQDYSGPGYKFKIEAKDSVPYISKIMAAEIAARAAANEAKEETKTEKVLLSVNTRPPVKEGSNGMSVLNITPLQKTGTIQIMETPLMDPEKAIFVNVANHPEQPVYVNLAPGRYTAVYTDTANKKKSNNVNFFLGHYIYMPPSEGAAPLLERVTDTEISIYSNNSDHAQLKIAEAGETPSFTYVPLIGRRVTVRDLMPDTSYILATCDLYDSHSSKTVETKTMFSSNQPFDQLAAFLEANHATLKYGSDPLYLGILEEARLLQSTLPSTASLPDAVLVIKNGLHLEMTTIKESDFPNTAAYLARAGFLTKKTNMCYEIVMTATRLSNDRNYAINRRTLAMVPPMPETAQGMDSSFLAEQDTYAMEFYRQFKHVDQFASKVPAQNMLRNADGKLICGFLGKPGWKHYVHAMNHLSQRSPRLEFYVMTDAERTRLTKESSEEKVFVDMAIAEARGRGSYQFALSGLTQERQDSLVVANAKNASINLLPPPVVLFSSEDQIELDVDYSGSVGEVPAGYLAVLSSADSALYNTPKYKLPLAGTETIVFTAEEHGIRPEKAYLVWIEREDGRQVSPCALAYAHVEDDGSGARDDDRIHSYELGNYIERVKSVLSDAALTDTEVMRLVADLHSDLSVNENNFCSRLAASILSLHPRPKNESILVRDIFQARHDMDQTVDEEFFETPVLCGDLAITFPATDSPYIVSATCIKVVEKEPVIEITRHFSIPGEELSVPLTAGEYTALHATRSDLNSKSGLIFISHFSETAYGYKVNMEVNKS